MTKPIKETLMTTGKQTKTFIVRYPVTTFVDVAVERDANISEEELLDSISRDDLEAGTDQDDCAWDSLKSAWRDRSPWCILDEDGNDIQFN